MFSTYLNKLEELIEKRDFLTFGLLAVGVLMGLLFIRFLFNRVVEYFSSENTYYNLMQKLNKPDLDTEDCFNDCNSTEIPDSVKNDTLEPEAEQQELEALATEQQELEAQPLATEQQEPEAEQQELEAQPQELEAEPQDLEAQPQELEAQPQELEAQPQELEAQPQELEAEQQELEAFSEDNNKASDNLDLDLDLDMDLEEVSINYN